jgi:hypothetical protein
MSHKTSISSVLLPKMTSEVTRVLAERKSAVEGVIAVEVEVWLLE